MCSSVFAFPDITADGSITFGASIAAMLLVKGVNPLAATAAAFLAGMLAGAANGILHTRFRIQGLLSGILVMTALYSVNLHDISRIFKVSFVAERVDQAPDSTETGVLPKKPPSCPD